MSYSLFAWIFTIGGFLGYATMMFHSSLVNDRRKTLFIFGGGTSIAYILEYTLSNLIDLYTYQNLPVTFFSIPLVIPLGWVITFYGLYNISLDLTDSEYGIVGLTGVLGMMFGVGIEALARNSDFWVFNFENKSYFGIPVNVIFAWGFSTANFSMGIQLFDKYQSRIWWIWLPILLLVHVVNLTIAVLLS
ncbi:MAG: hypothetical protein ACW99Q_17775 [Candidatus Kariarchaeaceae archaeon]|jgi:hypothetical protein